MRYFVGFFGLCRSAAYTSEAISLNILAPLQATGHPVISVAHFNWLDRISNTRSNEHDIPIDRAIIDRLTFDHLTIEPQDDAAIRDVLEALCTFPDPFGDDYASVRNLCHQLNSLRKLWLSLTSLENREDDIFLLLRHDLLYLDRLDPVGDFAPLIRGEADLIVPHWHGWGGLNDRFAFCTRHGAKTYASRFERMIEAVAMIGAPHSESVLAYVAERESLKVGFTPTRAVRTRADGAIASRDLPLMEPHRSQVSAPVLVF